MKKIRRPRWLSYLLVFLIILFLWTTLAAAADSNIHTEIPNHPPVPGVLHPNHTTFGITIGAIVLLTIVITSAVLRKPESS